MCESLHFIISVHLICMCLFCNDGTFHNLHAGHVIWLVKELYKGWNSALTQIVSVIIINEDVVVGMAEHSCWFNYGLRKNLTVIKIMIINNLHLSISWQIILPTEKVEVRVRYTNQSALLRVASDWYVVEYQSKLTRKYMTPNI